MVLVSLSPRSSKENLSGIAYMFKSKSLDVICPTSHPTVCQTLKASQPTSSQALVRKDPLNSKLLKFSAVLVRYLFDDVFLLLLAILLFGFAGLHQLGKLVIPDNKDLFDDRKLIYCM